MENDTNQQNLVNQTQPQPPVNQSINQPAEKPKTKSNFSLVLILSFTTIIATLIAGFFYFQNIKLRNELIKSLPSPTPILTPTSSPSLEPIASPKTESKVLCPSPKPEVCTEECLVNPPYICGSDGKSYCTTCQACANEKVEWYQIQENPCEEK